MKKRNTVFGYQYQNGVLTIHPHEEITLKQIFDCYLKGLSLLKIAEMLNAEKVEYSPGVTGWNKARLMRIVENEKYLGDETYPALVESETYEKAQRLKLEKNTQKRTDRKADIFQINLPVICGTCGSEMHRRHDSRNKCRQRWTCQNGDCHNIISITDDDFLRGVTDCLNIVIANPAMLKEKNKAQVEPSNEVRRLEYEITKTLGGFKFDKEALRKKMMECVSFKYKDIDSTSHIVKRLRADFEQSSPLITFSADFCSKTIKSIQLSVDKEISIILINDQQIGKGQNDDTDSHGTSTESSSAHTGDH